jgi:mannose-6-phosphate isomerase-like protein (cupin superfamily)
MLVRHAAECEEMIAGDQSILRELLHPDKADVQVRCSLAQATIRPGQRSRPHRLRAAEIYVIIEGRGIMCIDQEREAVQAGDLVYIPPQAVQHIVNSGVSDLRFICVVDPAWRREDEEVL